MSSYRTSLRNLHNETRFSIPLNNTSIKRRILINKLGLSQELEFALVSQSSLKNSKSSASNAKLMTKAVNLSKLRTNSVPIPYINSSNNKIFSSSDIDDNVTVYNDRLRSPTPDLGEDLSSYILSRKGSTVLINGIPFDNGHNFDIDNENNTEIPDDITLCPSNETTNTTNERTFSFHRPKINVLRKCKSFDIDYVVEDVVFLNDIKTIKEEQSSMIETSNELHDIEAIEEDQSSMIEPPNELHDIETIEEGQSSMIKPSNELHDIETIEEDQSSIIKPSNELHDIETIEEDQRSIIKPSNELHDIETIKENQSSMIEPPNELHDIETIKEDQSSMIESSNEIYNIKTNKEDQSSMIEPSNEDQSSMFEPSSDLNDTKIQDELTEVIVVESIKDNNNVNSSNNPKDQSEEIIINSTKLSIIQENNEENVKEEQNLNSKSDETLVKGEIKLPKGLSSYVPQYMEPEQDETFELEEKEEDDDEKENNIKKDEQERKEEKEEEENLLESSSFFSSSFSSSSSVFSTLSNKEIKTSTPEEPKQKSELEPKSSEAEELLLKFVAYDEQEKTRLQQAIIDQTTQRLNEKQQEADRLTQKINQQKVKMEEQKGRQRRLTRQLELKRRQSAELRLKLSFQHERGQQQQKELNYYKEVNAKYMEANLLLQEKIRELTKIKYLKV